MSYARGWHQTAIDKAHESAATLKIDREAVQLAAQEHLESVTVPQTEGTKTGG